MATGITIVDSGRCFTMSFYLLRSYLWRIEIPRYVLRTSGHPLIFMRAQGLIADGVLGQQFVVTSGEGRNLNSGMVGMRS